MTRTHWIALLATATTIAALGGAQAQGQGYNARDGRAVFTLSGPAVQAAYNSFCTDQAQLRCDALDRYDLMVNFDASAARLSFIHRSSGPAIPGMAMSFSCTHAGQSLVCTSR